MSAVRVNAEWLSVCGGCEVAIVDLHEQILDVLGAVQLQRCPVLTDVKDYPKAEVGLVSGAIRNEHDRHAAEQMRASCDTIIAWGTCAVYGGIPGAGIVHTSESIFEAAYGKNRTTVGGHPPTRRVDTLETRVVPLDSVIPVDLYLPGCPPHPAFILEALLSLVQGRPPKTRQETVCARCKRTMVKTAVDRIKSNHEGDPDPDQCLLSQGYVCLGSVTLDRCASPCPNNGVMCTGCAGPTMQVLTEPNRDIRTEVAERMSKLTAIPAESVQHSIEYAAKSHYSYAMATSMIGGKPTFLIDQWIADAEADA
ncbi:MAG: methyl viologen-reducing hydrogenase [Acidobacteriota bacterium]